MLVGQKQGKTSMATTPHCVHELVGSALVLHKPTYLQELP